jgi:hypothetical protein
MEVRNFLWNDSGNEQNDLLLALNCSHREVHQAAMSVTANDQVTMAVEDVSNLPALSFCRHKPTGLQATLMTSSAQTTNSMDFQD